ncbi:phage baseplate assembly protein V [Nissabacter sp. SGAir0207]|uniref:phage baseplate assembly protein V n=1 Tax=Nissabacter sp. SGAir0207 TaxID=2126321 RepID=UPI0010CCDC65|nr:phage baseplate assembly protein V [Nissabacter sp. SGAir0207]QCR38005.1 phage baseplate assembly protein V [Nissabacter sp. SGAir0207]
MNEKLSDIQRLLRNLIRIGTVSAVNVEAGLCRVETGGNLTTWLHWLTSRAGQVRTWHAPSVGEQVLVLALGGELDTAFVLPGIFSDQFPAPSASADAVHLLFPDGAVIEYEPETGALRAEGIQSGLIKAATKITLDTPEVECTQHLKAATLEVTEGGTMKGNVTHSGGRFSSNGIVVDAHKHGGVQSGGSTSGGPQ